MRGTFLVVLALGGCSSVSETFDSVPGQGVGSKPITVVNHMVDEGQLKGSALDQEPSFKKGFSLVGIGPVDRLPEKTIHVWLAPYVDEGGNLHEASHVRTVIQPSSWQSQFKAEKGEGSCSND